MNTTKTDLLATEALMNIATIKAARSPRTAEQERDARGRMFSERSSHYLSRGATNRQAYELAMDDVAAQF